MIYYFAYGSNLNVAQLMTRIGKWRSVRKAILKNYKLVFDVYSQKWSGLTSNIKECNSELVYGVIYEISMDQLNILTKKYEHKEPTKLDKVFILDGDEKKLQVYTYVFSGENKGEVPENYLNTIIEGLRQHDYGGEVIEKVRKIAEGEKVK